MTRVEERTDKAKTAYNKTALEYLKEDIVLLAVDCGRIISITLHFSLWKRMELANLSGSSTIYVHGRGKTNLSLQTKQQQEAKEVRVWAVADMKWKGEWGHAM